MKKRTIIVVATTLSSIFGIVSCSDDSTDYDAVGGDGALSNCPATVTLQTNWFPEPEHSAAYQMIDPSEADIDANAGVYSGPALADPNVTIKIQAGGPFNGFQTTTAQLYSDDSIILAMIDSDESVRLSGTQPSKAVFTPFQHTPGALFWDPEKYDFEKFEDIGKSDAVVQYFEGQAYMEYLVQEGYIRKDQIDGSFDGSVTRLVSGEDIVMQGYVTQEPWRLKHEFTDYGRDVGVLRLDDAGYNIYPSAWAGRPDAIASNSECLSQLVPAMQRSQVEYMKSPDAVNSAISRYLEDIGQFFQISPEFAASTAGVMASDGLVVDGLDGVMGSFDPDRMRTMTDKLVNVFNESGSAVSADLTADSLYTNEFLDPTISLNKQGDADSENR